jgi:Fic family protein
MTTDEDLVRRLDTIIAILQLAHRDEIESARATIRSDKVNTTILDGTKTWTPAGKLTSAVKAKTKQSPATINRRIADLLGLGVLEKQGGGPATEYRATGLI